MMFIFKDEDEENTRNEILGFMVRSRRKGGRGLDLKGREILVR